MAHPGTLADESAEPTPPAPSSSAAASARDSSQPARITRLPDDVINRIAAGEVVVRPSAALKELLENSLDAGATAITVSARDGGLKQLSIADDGHGIRRDDLPLLCERYATSKISRFSDLDAVATFGFRGEALASVSHVARLSVRTKTADSAVGYAAAYLDGRLRAHPAPVAAVDGTTVIVDDMFYNLPTRRAALRSPPDEYRAIVDVVARYAIRYPAVAFVCRRLATSSGSASSSARVASADVRTQAGAAALDNIRAAFGATVANETMEVTCDVAEAHAKINAIVSTANFSMKKGNFVLFINGRLVECNPLKRATLAAYAPLLPKGNQPFAYVDINMRQQDIDVNVHPMKKEVRFLHESVIIESFVDKLAEQLKSTETSRTFYAQSIVVKDEPTQSIAVPKSQPGGEKQANAITENVNVDGEFDDVDYEIQTPSLQPGAKMIDADGELVDPAALDKDEILSKDDEDDVRAPVARASLSLSTRKRRRQSFFQQEKQPSLSLSQPFSSDTKNVYAKDKVRTSSSNPVGLFDKFLVRNKGEASAADVLARRRRRPDAMPMLTSVENLMEECRQNGHKDLIQILKEHTFVGVISTRFVLLQHGTRLLLAEVVPLTKELMYQQTLAKFADHDTFELNPPAPLKRLVESYLDARFEKNPEETTVVSAESCVNLLLEKGPMLGEYFGMEFTGEEAKDGELKQLPLLFASIVPDIKLLGEFLYELAVNTDWSEERGCFRDVSRALSEWYGRYWNPLTCAGEGKTTEEHSKAQEKDNGQAEGSGDKGDESSEKAKKEEKDREWMLHHVLFASMRSDFYPPRTMFTSKVIRELTSTSKLYRIFERC